MTIDQGVPTGPTDDTSPEPPAPPDASSMTQEDLLAEVKKTRKEAAGYRTRLRALEATIPEDFEAAIKQRDETIRSLRIDHEVEKAIARHGMKSSITRAALIDAGTMAKFDPGKNDFQETIEDAIGELAVEMPELRAQSTAAVRSGAHFPGGNNGTPQLTRAELQGMSPDEINSARDKGQLDDVLGRRR